MQVEVFRFLAGDENTDRERLFFWFMTKIIGLADAQDEFTMAKYDFIAIVRGSSTGAFTTKSVSKNIKKWFRIGFVSEGRLTIRLTEEALSYFVVSKGHRLACSPELVELSDPSVKAMYMYLLGTLNASPDMFYEGEYWGLGDISDLKYHQLTKLLDRVEIQEVLNASLD